MHWPSMRMVRRLGFGWALGSLAIAPASVSAQRARYVALDATAGVAKGFGGGPAYTARDFLAGDLLLSLRWRGKSGHSPVVAVSTGIATRNGDEACAVPCPVPYPRFRYHAVHVGWELLSTRGASLRTLAGASWDANRYHVEDRRPGWHVRGDAASPAVGIVSLVAYIQSHGATSGPSGLGMWGGGVGLRLR